MTSLLRSPRSGWLAAALAIVALGGFAGCANTGGDYTYVTTISTGERMKFPLRNGRPELAKVDTIRIRVTGLNRVPGKEKVTAYEFGFEDTSGLPLKSVRVDDVSDKTEIPLLDDQAPELKNKLYWLGTTKPFDAESPEIYWLPYLDDTTRVFRFTVKRANGQEIVLYQAWYVPSFIKAGVRAALGLEH